MIKQILSLILLTGVCSSVSADEPIPFFIDFNTEKFDGQFFDQKIDQSLIESFPFNGAVEMSTFFMYIKDKYHLNTLIETGTFKGNSTGFFAKAFDIVHTIEVDPGFYSDAEANLKNYSNVKRHLGSSPAVLGEILPSFRGSPVLFYLDAHWYKDWPLLDELKVISKTHKDNCVIIIDDFKVPGRTDVPYDIHCEGQEYAFEYIQSNLKKVLSEFTIHYLIPKNVQSRAKFVAIPKKWAAE